MSSETASKKATYVVLSNLMHQDEETPRSGKLFRKGEEVRLSDEHAAPLLESNVVRRAPPRAVQDIRCSRT